MKLTKILIVFVLLIFSISPVFCTENVIETKVGNKFKIELKSNPSTGYQWQLEKPLDKNFVKLVSSNYFHSNTPLIGAGGKEVWVFKAIKKGETVISLKYVRSWEVNQPAAENIEYLIKIK